MKKHPHNEAESLFWRDGCKKCLTNFLFFRFVKKSEDFLTTWKGLIEKCMCIVCMYIYEKIIFTFELKLNSLLPYYAKKIKHDFVAKNYVNPHNADWEKSSGQADLLFEQCEPWELGPQLSLRSSWACYAVISLKNPRAGPRTPGPRARVQIPTGTGATGGERRGPATTPAAKHTGIQIPTYLNKTNKTAYSRKKILRWIFRCKFVSASRLFHIFL